MASDDPLWTARAFARAAGGRWLAKPPKDWRPAAVAYNLLTPAAPGQIVLCMHPASWGPRRSDTSRRLPTWIKGGALAAVVQNEQLVGLPRLPKQFPLLLVDDTRLALSKLARAGRERFEGVVVALTGTVGKTTTREMLRHALSPRGGAVATIGNNNNVPGVERTLASTPATAGWCICELGFGQPRDGIETSSRICRPHVALVTHVGPAHLDVFPAQDLKMATGVELIARAKAGIFAGLMADGVAVLGRDHDQYGRLDAAARERGARVVSYGVHADADARVVEIDARADGSTATCEIAGRRHEVRLRVPGMHMALNALGTLTVVEVAGGDVAAAAASLETFEPIYGRARTDVIETAAGRVTMIDDSFNATPASVNSTLDLLALHEPGPGGRRVAVLGDILHLGPLSARMHAALADKVAEAGVDRVLTIGDAMKRLHGTLSEPVRGIHAADLEDLYRGLLAELRDGDVLTLKASTPVGLGAIAEGLRRGSPSLGALTAESALRQTEGRV